MADPLPTTIIIDSTRIKDYSDILSHAITKFVLFVSQGEVGILVDSKDELMKHITGVSCVLRSLLHPSSNSGGITAGPTLSAQILTVHRAIFTGIKAILKQLESYLLNKQSTKLDVSLTGRAWEVLEKQLKSIPLTNATAVGRSINQQCSVLKDAKSELDEIHIASEGDEKDEDDDDDGLNDDDDDGDIIIDAGGDDALTAEEFEIVPSVKHLTTTAQNLVKSLYMYLLKVKIDESVKSNVDWLELVLKQVEGIGIRMDDLVGSLYAPQNRAEVLKAIQTMVKELRSNALSIVQHNVSAHAEWPMKSAAGLADPSAPSSFAACVDCQAVIDEANQLQSPADEHHAHRLDWLKKVITQIHEGHTQAEACKSTL